ncbi:MAG: hypothetical protein AABZ47_06940 [Planctomycetota bacterium]
MTSTTIANPSAVMQGVERDVRRLKEVSGKVIGSAFFETMLKTMRNSKIQGTVGHGGRGEKIFAGQLHGTLAERMGSAPSGLGDELFRHLEHQQRLISKALSSETLA